MRGVRLRGWVDLFGFPSADLGREFIAWVRPGAGPPSGSSYSGPAGTSGELQRGQRGQFLLGSTTLRCRRLSSWGLGSEAPSISAVEIVPLDPGHPTWDIADVPTLYYRRRHPRAKSPAELSTPRESREIIGRGQTGGYG